MNPPLLPFDKAIEIVSTSPLPAKTEVIDFKDSLFRILAEDVLSDMDMPPFNKSAMDGFACRQEDLDRVLEVIEVVAAGQIPTQAVTRGRCTQIMTGAMLPDGADIVLKIEDTIYLDNKHIQWKGGKSSGNICYQAEDVLKGQKVLTAGTVIHPQHIAILASVGHTRVKVYSPLRAAILSTGDELVEPGMIPGPGLIRNSNAWQLLAQCEAAGIHARYYGIVTDEKIALKKAIGLALSENDIILLTGGVSMGEYDYVPEVLEEMGFTILFRKLAVQPGSPTLYATHHDVRCFGLPGNPVSSFVQFEMLVKPLIRASMGHPFRPAVISLPLGAEYKRKKAERLSLIPVRIDGGSVFPLDYHGSAHIHAYTDAQGIMGIPSGITHINQGDQVDVRLL